MDNGKGGTTGEPPNPAAENHLEKLRSQATALLENLESAAEALRERNVLPTDSLSEAITDLRAAFQTSWDRLRDAANDAGIELESLSDEFTLTSLESISREIQDAIAARQSADDEREVTAATLQRVAALRVVGGSEGILDRVLADSARLAEALAQSELEPSVATEIANGGHPLVALLALADPDSALSDDEWDRCRASISDAFGSGLATAVARGRVRTLGGTQTETTREKPVEESLGPITADSGERTAPEIASPEHGSTEEIAEGSSAEPSSRAAAEGKSSAGDDASSVPSAKEPPPMEAHGGDAEIVPPPSIEESATALARRALACGADDRPRLVEGLIWKLLVDGRFALACGLDRVSREVAGETNRVRPDWILPAALLGPELRSPTGPIARRLEEDFLRFGEDCFVAGADEWNGTVRVLLAAAALQPAILAPATSAPALLHGLRLEESDLH